jgi:REP element-mobilizing transposase RayT
MKSQLFQNSIVDTHYKSLDENLIKEKFQHYTDNYKSDKHIREIRTMKEEEYQDGFLRHIFVDILGYTLKGDTGLEEFNLVREKKNIGDGKKADGAVTNGLKANGNDNVILVIELKSSTTSDLDKIEKQAFGYKNDHGCEYVVTSNFEFLRFYYKSTQDYESFNLFSMNFEQFKLFYLILSKQSIFSDLPAKMKAQSLEHEQDVSKKLYKDYSLFKRKLFDNLVKNNPSTGKLTLLHNSQKILDRLLFIFFAEDKGLIPANTITNNIIAHFDKLKELDAYTPLYNIFKQYFSYIDTGHKGKPYDTHGYNGDLFKSDAELDSLIIDDEILYHDTQKLSEYDFESEVDVNILGHIFEHSLNEIEALQAEIKGEDFDSKTSKRKKDGVFYTPKYITKYIVDNTVGKLCTEKKAELQIIYEDYEKGRKGLQQKTINTQIQKLKDYRTWLLDLKICDPACGSGAFLNQALEFLIHEHHYIDKLDSIYLGGDIVYPNVEKSILENNLYGVDINDEAIEIAKLSLWLRTAQKGRKLSSLHSKIKVGNSLIDDPEVAGDKAFNWKEEFPEVFKAKELKAFHVTWVTHNSRATGHKGNQGLDVYPVILNDGERNEIAKYLDEKIDAEDYRIIELNILTDHVHCLIVCSENEISKIIGQLKGYSSFHFHKNSNDPNRRVNPTVEKAEEVETAVYSDGTIKKLWASSFNKKLIKSDEQIINTINYIKNNHLKHEITELKYKFVSTVSYSSAFLPQYAGGFDCVIGNPPYGAELNFVFEETNESYLLFYKLGINILKAKGCLSFITPDSWLINNNSSFIRQKFLSEGSILSIKDVYKVFKDAPDVWCNIPVFYKYKYKNDILISRDFPYDIGIFQFYLNSDRLRIYGSDAWYIYISNEFYQIFSKMNGYDKVEKYFDVKRGFSPTPNSLNLVFNKTNRQVLGGEDFGRFLSKIKPKYLIDNYAKSRDSIDKIQSINLIGIQRIRTNNLNFKSRWLIANYFEKGLIPIDSIGYFIEKDNQNLKYLLCIINSKLLNIYYKMHYTDKNVKPIYLKKIPIKKITPTAQTPFIAKANIMLDKNKELQEVKSEFLDWLKDRYELEKLSKKLETFEDLDQEEFSKELKKKLPKEQRNFSPPVLKELKQYFTEYKTKAQAIKQIIDTTDKEIDRMVYELYELSEDEIKIVEGG